MHKQWIECLREGCRQLGVEKPASLLFPSTSLAILSHHTVPLSSAFGERVPDDTRIKHTSLELFPSPHLPLLGFDHSDAALDGFRPAVG